MLAFIRSLAAKIIESYDSCTCGTATTRSISTAIVIGCGVIS